MLKYFLKSSIQAGLTNISRRTTGMSSSTIKSIIVGASGGIGHAVLDVHRTQKPDRSVLALSRSTLGSSHSSIHTGTIDLEDPDTIEAAISHVPDKSIDFAFIATGVLHGASFGPEKATKMLNAETMQKVMMINTIGPALMLKALLPKMVRDSRAVIGAISARVGSIGDNRLGGWHSYRASKSALNMIIKTVAIEAARTHPQLIITGLHPGTVVTDLSEPFRSTIPKERLFTPDYSATRMLEVLDQLNPQDSGNCFAFDGSRVPF